MIDAASEATVVGIIQMLLGIVLGYSSIAKLRSPGTFTRQVGAYELLPDRVKALASWAVIAAELALAGSFLSGWMIVEASLVAMALFVVFGVAMVLVLRRHSRPVPCGCFGTGSEFISGRAVTRVGLLTLAAASLWVLLVRHVPGVSIDSSGLGWLTGYCTAIVGAIGVLLATRWAAAVDQVVEVMPFRALDRATISRSVVWTRERR